MKKLLLLITITLLTQTILFAQKPIKELENWASQQTEGFGAGEVVEFLNGGRAMGDITFGSGYVFNSATTVYISATTLDADQFIVVYQDVGNSKYGTAIIGTISDNIISYSSEFVFSFRNTEYISATTLDTNIFIVAYSDDDNSDGFAIVGTVNNDSISFGSEYQFSDYCRFISTTTLDSNHFVIAYAEYHGTAIIGTISGNSINFGSSYIFNSYSTSYISATATNSTKFVIAYQDYSNSKKGTVILGTVSDTIITYDSEVVFNSEKTEYIAATHLSPTTFVIAYKDGYKSNAIIGIINGNTISFGSEYLFRNSGVSYISISNLCDTMFVIAWQDGYYNTGSKTGSVSGDSIVYSALTPTWTGSRYNSVSTLDNSHFIIGHCNVGNSYFGTVVLGTVEIPSSTTIPSQIICHGDITIPITVQNLEDVTQFSLLLDYDTTNLAYTGFQNTNTQLSSGTLTVTGNSGEISMAWNSTTAANMASDTLLDLNFTTSTSYNQNIEDLTWDEANSYYLNSNGDSLSTVFNDGQVTIEPIVDSAGPITGSNNICQGTTSESYQVDTIANATSYVWELNPTNSGTIIGSGTNITIDYSATFSGQTTLSVYGLNSCGNGPSSSMLITVTSNPTANANVDTTICAYSTYTVLGSATNQQSVLWSTSGDGTFDDATSLTADYTPGSNDIASGTVTLTLTAYAIAPCATNAVDDIVLTFQQLPTANAGSNDTIGDNASYTLLGTTTNQQNILWSTAGDGTFDDATLLNATYTPGNNDIAVDSAILTLTAVAMAPCATNASDNMTLYIQPSQQIGLINGWNIASFYVIPNNIDLFNILQPIVTPGELTKVIDEQGNFIQDIPGFGWMNTIGNMANTEGYYIKVNQNTQLDLFGTLVATPFDIPLSTGWNIMGYPTQDTVNAITVLQPLIDSSYLTKVIDEAGGFIQEIPGSGWLNTIGNFGSGEGYYIKVNQNCTLTIGREPPTLTTDSVSIITSTSATSGGNIISDGGAPVTVRGVCWSTLPNPTLADSNTTDGVGTGTFTSNITGLMEDTTYYVRAYATNSEGTAYGNEILFVATQPPFNCGGLLQYEGQNYTTVQIGTQCWMAENMNVGTRIDAVNNQTNNSTIEKYCFNDDVVNCDTYGGLYQWDEMMQYTTTQGVQGICPSGWHLPTDDEWKTMEMHLGMTQAQADATGWRGSDEGEKIKSTSGWNFNGNGTNSSGFTALPGGGSYTDDGSYSDFYDIGNNGYWWSSTQHSGIFRWERILHTSSSQTNRGGRHKNCGCSLRCLKN